MLPQTFKVHALAFELRITCTETLQILTDLGLNKGKSQFSEVSLAEADAVRAHLKTKPLEHSETAAAAIRASDKRTIQSIDCSHIAPIVAVLKAMIAKKQAEEAVIGRRKTREDRHSIGGLRSAFQPVKNADPEVSGLGT